MPEELPIGISFRTQPGNVYIHSERSPVIDQDTHGNIHIHTHTHTHTHTHRGMLATKMDHTIFGIILKIFSTRKREKFIPCFA